MVLPRAFRNLAIQLARAVATHDLFEKPGERPHTPPLDPASRKGVDVLAGAVMRAGGAPHAGSTPAVSPSDAASEGTPAAKAPRRKAAKAAEAAPEVMIDRPSTGCVPVRLAGLRHVLTPTGKPIVVNHWASWCDPCVDELPRLVRAAAGVADIGEFMGVSWDLFDHPGDPAVVAKKVATFADSVGVGYGSVLFDGTPSELFEALGLTSELIPQTHVIAPDGKVVWSKNGVIDHDDVFPLIAAVKAAAGR